MHSETHCETLGAELGDSLEVLPDVSLGALLGVSLGALLGETLGLERGDSLGAQEVALG
jgi:hypothetical protein